MKPRILIFIILSVVTFSVIFAQKPVDDLLQFALSRQNDLQLGTYFTVNAVTDHLNTPEGRREAVTVLRSLGITKAYLETYRGGHLADETLLKELKTYFAANGIEAIGGIATTPGRKFGVRQEALLGWFNYQHPATQAALEKVVRLTARVFDKMIIDDFFCTADTSELSRQAKGERSWGQYRMDLMTELAQTMVLKPAREENPDIFTIIKYPQWYDRFHKFGYDVVREPPLFDQVWIGTETRSPDTRRMGFVPQYEGFVNFRWLSTFAPEKIGGAWFDHIECEANDFIDQAYQSVLAGAREIIFFNYFNLMRGHPGHHLLRRQFSRLFDLARLVREEASRGIYAYKPPYSDAIADHYIMDFIGMLGIPLLPASSFPAEAEVVFLPTQAARDQKILPKIRKLLKNGKTVVATPGFFLAAQNKKLEKLAGVEINPGEQVVTHLLQDDAPTAFDGDLELASKISVKNARTLLTALVGTIREPFLTLRAEKSGGKFYVLNVNTADEADFKAVDEVLLVPKPVAWLNLPVDWLNKIRAVFLQPLGIELAGPGRISLHLFANGDRVLCNFNNAPAEISLTASANTFELPFTETKMRPRNGKYTINLEKRSVVWLRAID